MKKRAATIFQSEKLAARAAYMTMFNERGRPVNVNTPKAFCIPWISGADYLIALHHWQSVRHNDETDGWGLVYTVRELAVELGLPSSTTHRALSRLEASGLIIHKYGVRVLWLHPYCIRLYLTMQREGEQIPLPEVERQRITAGLEASGAFLPVKRTPTFIPLNFELESKAYSLDELRAHCLALVSGPGIGLSITCEELGIDVGSLWRTVPLTGQARSVDGTDVKGQTADEAAPVLEKAM